MAYIAGKPLKLGDGIRQVGELVPEAEHWPHINSWLAAGDVIFVPDALIDQYVGNADKVSKVPYIGVAQPDAALESVYAYKNVHDISVSEVTTDDDTIKSEDTDEDGDDSTDETDVDSQSDNSGESEDPEVDSDVLEYIDDPADFNAKVVVEYAKEHPEHAEMLYDSESEGKNRSTVLNGLKALVESSAQ